MHTAVASVNISAVACRYGYVVASYGMTGLWMGLTGVVMWAGNEKTLWSTSKHYVKVPKRIQLKTHCVIP